VRSVARRPAHGAGHEAKAGARDLTPGPRPFGLVGVELVRVAVPLREVWASGGGTFGVRDSLLARAVLKVARPGGGNDEVEGWGECGALPAPTYTSEYTEAAAEISDRYLVPALLGADVAASGDVGRALAGLKGHNMAKAALEAAVLDAEARGLGVPLARSLASTSEPEVEPAAEVGAGVAVGLHPDEAQLLDEVERHVSAGYRRVKLKLSPRRAVRAVAAVRDRWPELVLFADANAAYSGMAAAEVARELAPLEDMALACLEQPMGDEDLAGHAELAERLRVPICLDESLGSYAAVVNALKMGACSVVCVKPGRLGGYLAAVRTLELCASRGVPAWVGGMVETGIGRAANLALASLPMSSLPGDLSASGRFFDRDLASPVLLTSRGTLPVPDSPGLGVAVDEEAVGAFCTWRRWYER